MRWEETVHVFSKSSNISENLQNWVSLLTQLLEQIIVETEDESLIEPLSQLPVLSAKAFHDQDKKALDSLQKQLAAMPLPLLVKLLRMYTVFFHLVNSMEQHEIMKINRNRALKASPEEPRAESIDEAVYLLKKKGYNFNEAVDVFKKLDIQPTITAHPTEARRFSVLMKQQHITDKISSIEDEGRTKDERQELVDEILNEIALLLATDEVRSERLTVDDEVENGLFYFIESIWETIPKLYLDINRAFRQYYEQIPDIPTILKYRSWIGSDRDGNPFVTSDVTWETALKHRRTVLELYIQELQLLLRFLSISDKQVTIPVELGLSLEKDSKEYPLSDKFMRHYKHEPYRRKISHMIMKLEEQLEFSYKDRKKILAAADKYRVKDFINDLELIRQSLLDSGLNKIAKSGPIFELIIRAKTFGFHLASMDIRQHSALHEQTVTELFKVSGEHEDYESLSEDEKVELLTKELINPRPLRPVNTRLNSTGEQILEVFGIVRDLFELDSNLMGSYIISMTHGVSDMLEVLILAKELGIWKLHRGDAISILDVCPLFETIEDLEMSDQLMQQIYTNHVYQRHLMARDRFQEIMLGYSDSNKDGGYWMANWALQKAQHKLGHVCETNNVDFRLFHGRGGSVGRGGGRSNKAILSLPSKANNGRIRFTEQGEVISFRYSLPELTRRHLEQIVHAMVQGVGIKEKASDKYLNTDSEVYKIMEELATTSMKAYRNLIDDAEFWGWYTKITPIEHISRLPIASRPVSRSGGKMADFGNLRAIPWVFAWTQLRYNIPGWYGTGQAMKEVMENNPNAIKVFNELYEEWDFFITVLDNAQREIARTELNTSSLYTDRLDSDDHRLHEVITADFSLATEAILKVTNQENILDNRKVIMNSIEFRNPFTYALNFMQVELLERWRDVDFEHQKDPLRHALFLSINGIAAAMQSTG